jgi:hypothetical protein
MNFIALIGIVEKFAKTNHDDNHKLLIKVEKPYIETNDEDWYDIVCIQINKDLVQNDIDNISKGSIVGIKGRLQTNKNITTCIAERIQLF